MLHKWRTTNCNPCFLPSTVQLHHMAHKALHQGFQSSRPNVLGASLLFIIILLYNFASKRASMSHTPLWPLQLEFFPSSYPQSQALPTPLPAFHSK